MLHRARNRENKGACPKRGHVPSILKDISQERAELVGTASAMRFFLSQTANAKFGAKLNDAIHAAPCAACFGSLPKKQRLT